MSARGLRRPEWQRRLPPSLLSPSGGTREGVPVTNCAPDRPRNSAPPIFQPGNCRAKKRRKCSRNTSLPARFVFCSAAGRARSSSCSRPVRLPNRSMVRFNWPAVSDVTAVTRRTKFRSVAQTWKRSLVPSSRTSKEPAASGIGSSPGSNATGRLAWAMNFWIASQAANCSSVRILQSCCVLAENLSKVEERIHKACAGSGRRRDEVTLIAVTKVFPADVILEGYEVGLRHFGENYVQEFSGKAPAVAHLTGAVYHLIGHLQSNKSKIAAEIFHSVQTVDSGKLARRLNDHGRASTS